MLINYELYISMGDAFIEMLLGVDYVFLGAKLMLVDSLI